MRSYRRQNVNLNKLVNLAKEISRTNFASPAGLVCLPAHDKVQEERKELFSSL